MAVTLTNSAVIAQLMERSKKGMPPEARAAAYQSDIERVDRLLAVAAAYIERRAPNAPEEAQDEAALLFIAYALERGGGDPEGVRGAPNVWRHSGALSVLAPWRAHRAGKCEPPA